MADRTADVVSAGPPRSIPGSVAGSSVLGRDRRYPVGTGSAARVWSRFSAWRASSAQGGVVGQVQGGHAGGGRDGEQPLGFPPAGGVLGEDEQLHPGGDLAGHGDDGAPDPVLVQVV